MNRTGECLTPPSSSLRFPAVQRALALLLGTAVLGGAACQRGEELSAVPEAPPPAVEVARASALFRDLTAESGVAFAYRNGEEADRYTILESLGGGLALLDYDGDGLLDLFVPGGGYFDGPDHRVMKGYPSRLYKNLGGWKFKDVTKEVGLDQPVFYTHGCAVADYDRDGWPDLLVTGWGRTALYHNEPDGKGGRRFREVSKQAGLAEGLWSTSAAWADLDGDGFPDLYVCQYLDWSFANDPVCEGLTPDVRRDICSPKRFRALPHRLYRNNGNGTFTDVSRQAGLRQNTSDDGKGLGVLIVDVNDDGRPDVYVANDTTDNLLYLNRGGGRLEEKGLLCGVAQDDDGGSNGSMGVDAADFEGSGRPALWVANYEGEYHALYRNDMRPGRESFTFVTHLTGIARLGQRYVAWGTGFLDLDNDGWEDLVVSNGHVVRHPRTAPLRQQSVLLRNATRDGRRWFADVTAEGGAYFQTGHRGRGLVIGDLDNDGRADLIVSHQNEPVVLLRNEDASGHHWLGVELLGRDHRDVTGARVTLEVGGRRLKRFAKGGGSYLSSGDRRLLFGLGKTDRIGRLTVAWPWGGTESWDGLSIDRYHRLREGTGSTGSPNPGSS
jgi:enediyne biosynthesis protein E4